MRISIHAVAAVIAMSLGTLACHKEPVPQLVPHSDVVANSTFTVEARTWRYYTVTVTGIMYSPHLEGSFTASGGSGNDIKVLIMTETDYTNWSNGHAVNPAYYSGQLTTSTFDVSVGTGKYYIVYDNTFSSVSNKSVRTTVHLNYMMYE